MRGQWRYIVRSLRDPFTLGDSPVTKEPAKDHSESHGPSVRKEIA